MEKLVSGQIYETQYDIKKEWDNRNCSCTFKVPVL